MPTEAGKTAARELVWSLAERVSASELRPGDSIRTAGGEPAVVQEIQFMDAAYIFTTRGTFRRFNKTAPTILRANLP